MLQRIFKKQKSNFGDGRANKSSDVVDKDELHMLSPSKMELQGEENFPPQKQTDPSSAA
jgi:hypothetical protein